MAETGAGRDKVAGALRGQRLNAVRARLMHLRSYQPVRYVVVGVLNTSLAYLIYAAGLRFGLSFQIASLVSLIIGILVSFLTQGSLVFGDRSLPAFGRYVVTWGAVYVFNISIIAGLLRLGMDAYVAGAVATVPTIGISYVIQKLFVFRPGPVT